MENLSLNQTLVVCEKKLEDATYPECCLSLVRKDSVTDMHGEGVYMKNRIPFPRDLCF